MLLIYCITALLAASAGLIANLDAGISLIWLVPLCFLATFLGLIILQLLIFVICTLLISVNKPAERFSRAYRFLVKILLDVLVPIVNVKIEATGLERVPKSERFLIVSNHLHEIDPAIFFHMMPQAELAFIGKKEIYSNMKFIAKAMHKLLGLPIDRENNRNAIITINKAANLIKEDKASVAIFPEGYTSLSGELLSFRNGAFKIAKKAHCPIVVAVIKNTKNVVKNMFFKTTIVNLDIIEVLSAEQVDGMSTAEISDYIHNMMYNKINEKRDA